MQATTTLHIEIPSEFAGLLGTQQQASQIAVEFIALGLYQEGQISSGKAAELLGMTKSGFLSFLSRKGINYFQMSSEEWEAEVNTVNRWAQANG